MADITIQVPESEYNSILRQPVAVIDKTRNIVAASVTSAIGAAHWELFVYLYILVDEWTNRQATDVGEEEYQQNPPFHLINTCLDEWMDRHLHVMLSAVI